MVNMNLTFKYIWNSFDTCRSSEWNSFLGLFLPSFRRHLTQTYVWFVCCDRSRSGPVHLACLQWCGPVSLPGPKNSTVLLQVKHDGVRYDIILTWTLSVPKHMFDKYKTPDHWECKKKIVHSWEQDLLLYITNSRRTFCVLAVSSIFFREILHVFF